MKGKYIENIYYFQHEEKAYLEFIIKNEGFVYNDFGGRDASNKKLHHYDCKSLHNLGGGKLRTSVRKICSQNKGVLISWLDENRGILGKGYTECPCMSIDDYSQVDLNRI